MLLFNNYVTWIVGVLLIAKLRSTGLFGVDAFVVEVEIDVFNGLPSLILSDFQIQLYRNQERE